MAKLFGAERLPARVDFVVGHIVTAIGLVANGVGIALVDEFFGRRGLGPADVGRPDPE